MYRGWFMVQPCGEAEDLSQPQMRVAAWYERNMCYEPRTAGFILAWHRHVRFQGSPWDTFGHDI
jgi:hypothetical protein